MKRRSHGSFPGGPLTEQEVLVCNLGRPGREMPSASAGAPGAPDAVPFSCVQDLQHAGFLLRDAGFVHLGVASGNMSLRHPHRPREMMVVTCAGARLATIGHDTCCVVTLDGSSSHEATGAKAAREGGCTRTWRFARALAIDGRTPSVETGMHAAILSHIPGANAVVHVHSPAATALSSMSMRRLRRLLGDLAPRARRGCAVNVVPYLNVERVAKVGPIAWCPSLPAGCVELHDAVWRLLAHGSAIALVLQSHGLVTIGRTLNHAVETAICADHEIRLLLDITGGSGQGRAVRCLPVREVDWIVRHLGSVTSSVYGDDHRRVASASTAVASIG